MNLKNFGGGIKDFLREGPSATPPLACLIVRKIKSEGPDFRKSAGGLFRNLPRGGVAPIVKAKAILVPYRGRPWFPAMGQQLSRRARGLIQVLAPRPGRRDRKHADGSGYRCGRLMLLLRHSGG